MTAALTLQLAPESLETIRRHSAAAENCGQALWEALQAAGEGGRLDIGEQVARGETGLVARHTEGLVNSIRSWPIDQASLLVAVGVPANSPAALYAGALERGSTIYPTKGKALAVPISAEAKKSGGPREMEGLFLLPRIGRPPLLVRQLKGGRITPHWVLVPSVSLRRHAGWFSRAAREAMGAMAAAFDHVWSKYVRRWTKGGGA